MRGWWRAKPEVGRHLCGTSGEFILRCKPDLLRSMGSLTLVLGGSMLHGRHDLHVSQTQPYWSDPSLAERAAKQSTVGDSSVRQALAPGRPCVEGNVRGEQLRQWPGLQAGWRRGRSKAGSPHWPSPFAHAGQC